MPHLRTTLCAADYVFYFNFVYSSSDNNDGDNNDDDVVDYVRSIRVRHVERVDQIEDG